MRNCFFKRTLAFASILSMLLAQTGLPQTVWAEGTAAGDLTISADSGTLSQADYSYAEHTLTILGTGAYTLSGTTTQDTVVVSSAATVTLSDLNITSSVCAFKTTSDNVTIKLKGTNTLTSGIDYAGLQNSMNSITITSAEGDGKTSGILTATGRSTKPEGSTSGPANGGAGIGGASYLQKGTSNLNNGGNITIKGGTIIATGGYRAAGIGGGNSGNGTNISISGGNVTAAGTAAAAGIGGGEGLQLTPTSYTDGIGSNITISGGTVTATGNGEGAGIGGGNQGHGHDITITGGTVTANSTGAGAGIGSGAGSVGYSIEITGGTVNASSVIAVGIGSALNTSSSFGYKDPNISGSGTDHKITTISIAGGKITASGGNDKRYAAMPGIGAYCNDADVRISGGTIHADGGAFTIDNTNYKTSGIGNLWGNLDVTITGGEIFSSGGKYIDPNAGTLREPTAAPGIGAYVGGIWAEYSSPVKHSIVTIRPAAGKGYKLYSGATSANALNKTISGTYTYTAGRTNGVTTVVDAMEPYIHLVEAPLITYTTADPKKGSVSVAYEILEPTDTPTGSTASALAGYTFLNWTNSSGNTVSDNPQIVPVKTGDVFTAAAYTANFTEAYTVHFDSNTGTGTMADAPMPVGFAKALPANTFKKPGYTFNGWNTSSTGSGTPYTDKQAVTDLASAQGSITLYATWKLIPAPPVVYFTIAATASPSAGGTVTGAGSVTAGSTVTLTANASTGYVFSGWYENGKLISTDPSLKFTASANRTLTANFFVKAASSVRLSGKTRYDTMAEIVKKAFPEGCKTAILTSGANWPDALAASSLAGVKDCPVLLTDPRALSGQTADAIKNLGVKQIYIIGGEPSVSAGVKTDLLGIGFTEADIERIAGKNRMETAEKIAQKVMETSTSDTIIIASGQDFPDAGSISAYAFAKQTPILLTQKNGTLTDTSKAFALKFANAIILGDGSAVSTDVETQLDSVKTVRLSGANRYATSLKIIHSLYGNTIPVLAVTTGTKFPDALIGGILAGRNGGAVLLVNGTAKALTKDQVAVIQKSGSVYILGAENTVSADIKKAVDRIMQ